MCTLGNIAGLSGLAYYASLDDDPYITLKDVVSVSVANNSNNLFRTLLTMKKKRKILEFYRLTIFYLWEEQMKKLAVLKYMVRCAGYRAAC